MATVYTEDYYIIYTDEQDKDHILTDTAGAVQRYATAQLAVDAAALVYANPNYRAVQNISVSKTDIVDTI